MHGDDEGPRYGGLGRALLLSLAVHALAVVALSFYKYSESHKLSLAPINMIELAEPGQTMHRQPATRRAAPPPPPPPPAPKRVEAPAPKPLPKVSTKPAPPPPLPVPVIPKKVEDSPPVRPLPPKAEVKPKPPPQPEMTEAELRERLKKMREKVGDKMEGVGANRRTESDVRASIEAMRSRNAEASPQPSPPPSRAEVPAPKLEGPAGTVAIGTGVAKGTVVDMRFTAYRTRLWEQVKGRWTLLPSLAGRGLTAVVVATVTRNGMVTNCWVEGSSGVEAFDQSALRAVLTASPLPEIPADIPEAAFADGIGFRFTE